LDISSLISPPNILEHRISSAHPLLLIIRSAQPSQYYWTSHHSSAHPIFLSIKYAQPTQHSWASDVLSPANIAGHLIISQPIQYSWASNMPSLSNVIGYQMLLVKCRGLGTLKGFSRGFQGSGSGSDCPDPISQQGNPGVL
jgi:hypothetical protein